MKMALYVLFASFCFLLLLEITYWGLVWTFKDSLSQCKIAWHKDGGLIAIPCDKEVHFYERESWICKFKIALPDEGGSAFLTSIVEFSPCGMIYVFSIVSNAMVFKYSYNKKMKICSLAWNPSDQSQLLFCDINGNMGNVKVTLNDASSQDSVPVKAKAPAKAKKTEEDLGKDRAKLTLTE